MARTSKGSCADSRASSGKNKGQDKDILRTRKDQKGLIKTNLGQAKDMKGLYEGQPPRFAQFYRYVLQFKAATCAGSPVYLFFLYPRYIQFYT